LLVVVRPGTVARADTTPPTDDVRAQARALVQEGARAMEAGRSDEAVERFSEAYRLVPSPKILFDLGVVYASVARNADALRAFEGFLREAADAPASSRAAARHHIDDLRAKVVELHITSDRPTADVTLDGRSLGPVTFDQPLLIDPGAHDLAARDGSEVARRAFTAEAGAPVELALTFSTSMPAAPPPSPSAALSVAPSATLEDVRPSREPPIHRRRWLWAVLGAGAAVAVAAALAVALSRTEYPAVDQKVMGP
jgi:hypothetical protein